MRIVPLALIAAVLLVGLHPINSFSTSGLAGTLVATGSLVGKGRMAEFDGTSAVLYNSLSGTGGVYAFFRNDSGQTSNVLLPNFPSVGNYGCAEYVMTSADEMWVLAGTGPVTAVQYRFSGSPLPSAATLVSSATFGDGQSFCPSLIRLASGALVGAWTENNAYNSTSGALGFAYRGTSGNWSQIFSYAVPYSTGGERLAIAQHPADSSIWAFTKQDGGQQIYAYHLTEAAGGILVDWSDPSFISQASDGPNGPEGEFPYLVAVSDKPHNNILLAYQDNQYKMFSTTLKGAYVSIAQINADRTKSFLVFPTYVENTDYLALISQQGSMNLGYFPINQTALTYTGAYFSSYNGTWAQPEFLGASYQNPPGLAYGINETQFGVDLSTAPGNQLWLFHLQSGTSTAMPPQSPSGLTAAAISSSKISLAWTAPSNNGGSAVTGYQIERSADGGTSWSKIVANTGSVSTSFADSGLAKNTSYAYLVSAINSAGVGSLSNIATAKTLKGH